MRTTPGNYNEWGFGCCVVAFILQLSYNLSLRRTACAQLPVEYRGLRRMAMPDVETRSLRA